MTISDLATGLSARSQAMARGRYRFTWRFHDAQKTLQMEMCYDVTCSDGKYIGTVISNPTAVTPFKLPRIERASWDGEKAHAYVEEPEALPQFRFNGTIRAREPWAFMGFCADLFWRETVLDSKMPVHELVRDGKWDILGTREVGGYQALGERQRERKDGRRGFLYEIWVAPDHGFAPIAIKQCHPDDGFATMELANITLTAREGQWLMQTADLDVNRHRTGSNAGTYHYEFEEFTRRVPEGMTFTVKFPIGADVWDEFSKTGFYAGKVVKIEDPKTGVLHLEPIDAYPHLKALTDYDHGLTEEEWKSTQIAALPVDPA